MRLEVFQDLAEALFYAKQLDESKAYANKNRKRSNWFILEANEKNYLKQGDDDHQSSKRNLVTLTPSAESGNSSDEETPEHKNLKVKLAEVVFCNQDDEKQGKFRNHKPQKWKVKEKELFFGGLEKYGQ
jgi:hypothetical protein